MKAGNLVPTMTSMCCALIISSAAGAQTPAPQPADWANETTAQRVESILGMQVKGLKGSESGGEGGVPRTPRGAGGREDESNRMSRFESRLGMLLVALAGLITVAAVASVFMQRKRGQLETKNQQSFDFWESLNQARLQLKAGDLTAALRQAHKAAGQRIAAGSELHYRNATDGRLSAEIKDAHPRTGFGKLSALFGRVIYGSRSADRQSVHEAIQIADALNEELNPKPTEREARSS